MTNREEKIVLLCGVLEELLKNHAMGEAFFAKTKVVQPFYMTYLKELPARLLDRLDEIDAREFAENMDKGRI